jgi:hypothetical protein
LIDAPLDQKLFLDGSAGSGKTTAAAARMLRLLDQGIPGGDMLIYVPQKALALPYVRALNEAAYAGSPPAVHTIGSISTRNVELYFPLIAKEAGFASPDEPPTLLSLETAQYVMARIVEPLLNRFIEPYFVGLRLNRNRLYSQILDNLNKAAMVGFDHTEIAERLISALPDPENRAVFEQVQDAAIRFRRYCLEHNLVDFSLAVEIFQRQIWSRADLRERLTGQYRHIIVDNVEEDVAASHRLLADLIDKAESALVIADSDAGFRTFLGGAPEHAQRLREVCQQSLRFTESLVASAEIAALENALGHALGGENKPATADPRSALIYDNHRFFPEMLDWVTDQIAALIDEGVPPGEIVVLSPILSDSLRFSLLQRLSARGIPARSHRPSRALREEPAALCLLTLARLAHPEWGMAPTATDIAHALMQSLGGVGQQQLDLIRADLLTEHGYARDDSPSRLMPFASLPPDVQERVSYVLGQRYDALREWLEAYIAGRSQPAEPPPPPKKKRGRKKKGEELLPPLEAAPPHRAELDHFFSLIYGEVLARRGFGFHDDFQAADAAARLVESARHFRRTMQDKAFFASTLEGKTLAQEYVEMVADGVIADQYVPEWQLNIDADAVLLAPAYTFLMTNTPKTAQFWLDVGSRAWFDRLYQPLTHPYVLGVDWVEGAQWNDALEVSTRKRTLYRLTIGLLRRCRARVYLGLSELSESGYPSEGELLNAVQRVLRRWAAQDSGDRTA